MNIKLVMCDLDGTMIGKDEAIANFIPPLIQDLESRGIRFAIATGRTPELAIPIIKKLGISGPCVMTNGAIVVQGQKILTKETFMVNPLQSYLLKAAELGMSVIFAGEVFDTILQPTPWLQKQSELFGRYQHVYMPQPKDWETLELSKITIWDKTRQIERVTDELIAAQFESYSIIKYDSGCVEIAPKGISKQTGVAYIAQMLSIDMSEVMAIGDHFNDLEMLTAAGIGVALGEAPEPVRHAADYVCKKPIALGVMESVHRFILPNRIEEVEGR